MISSRTETTLYPMKLNLNPLRVLTLRNNYTKKVQWLFNSKTICFFQNFPMFFMLILGLGKRIPIFQWWLLFAPQILYDVRFSITVCFTCPRCKICFFSVTHDLNVCCCQNFKDNYLNSDRRSFSYVWAIYKWDETFLWHGITVSVPSGTLSQKKLVWIRRKKKGTVLTVIYLGFLSRNLVIIFVTFGKILWNYSF